MIPGFVIFFFLGVTWSPSGLDTPTIQFELTQEACDLDRQAWIAEEKAKNDANPPGLWQPAGASPCQLVISTTGAKQS